VLTGPQSETVALGDAHATTAVRPRTTRQPAFNPVRIENLITSLERS
jgi:hypothetical protein